MSTLDSDVALNAAWARRAGLISDLPRPARVEGGDTLCLLVRRASFEPDCPRPKQCLSSLKHRLCVWCCSCVQELFLQAPWPHRVVDRLGQPARLPAACGPQGKGGVSVKNTVEAQGEGGASATRAVEARKKGSVFSHEGSGNTRHVSHRPSSGISETARRQPAHLGSTMAEPR